MKYFTKEYIELCRDERIQKLKKVFKAGDIVQYKTFLPECYGGSLSKNIMVMDRREDLTWLPTGDQLDEEIVKICKRNKYDYYSIFIQKEGYKDYVAFIRDNIGNQLHKLYMNYNNPLIAKIKLLLELLEKEKE